MMVAREGPQTFVGAAKGEPQRAPPAKNAPPGRRKLAPARRRLRSDQGGQMMLLSAFIFVIALLAMSAMVARVPLLAKQVSREHDRPVMTEVQPLVAGIDKALAHLATDFRPAIDGTSSGSNAANGNGTAFDAAVRSMLNEMRVQQASRGMVLEWRFHCPSVGGSAQAALTLTDGDLRIDATTNEVRCHAVGDTGSWTDAVPLPPPPPPPPAALVCAPALQTVPTNSAASFTATGGTGTYAWSSTGSIAPTAGSGAAYSATYASAGAYTVSVSSGAQTTTCAVTVSAGVICAPALQTVAVGQAASFTAVGGSGSYTWSSTGSNAPTSGGPGGAYSATYATAGSKLVTATDTVTTGTCTVTVEPPVVCSPGTQTVGLGQAAAFTVTGGSGTYAWSSPGSNAPTSGSGASYSATYGSAGSYTVTVLSGLGSGTCSVTASAALTCAPGTQAVGPNQAASFTAAGGTGTYAWDSTGSIAPTTGSGGTYSASYAGTGSYTVTVTSGAETATCSVTVDPLLTCSPASQAPGVGQSVTFTAGGGGASDSWSSPSSSAPTTGTGATYSASYPATGSYTVTVTSGTQTATCSVTVQTVLTCSPASQTIGATSTASFTAAGAGATKTWASPGGSPTSGSGAAYSASYASTGSYTATVSSGAQTANCAVTVDPLLVCSPSSQNVATGVNAALTASGGVGSYTWSSPGGSPTSGSGASYAVNYPGLGTYTVTLTSGGQTKTCSVVVNLLYTYVSDCEAKVGSMASCPGNVGASDGALATFTEGTNSPLATLYGTTVTKVNGGFSSSGNTCASSGTDTSGNAKLLDGAYACYEQKNDKLKVSSYSTTDYSGKITKVEIASKAKVTLDSGGSVTTNQIKLIYHVSGTLGATSGQATLSTADTTTYVDVTADRTWTWANIAAMDVEGDAQTANGNKEHLNVDSLWVRVTATGLDGRLRFTLTGVPASTTQTFQMDYKATTDTYNVQVWDGAAWNTRGATLNSASLTTWSYVLTAAEYQAGYPRLRVVDVTSGTGAPAGTVQIDYARIASS